MFDTIYKYLDLILGLSNEQTFVNVWQMAARAIVVYCVTLVLIRIGKKRFLATPSSFDLVLLMILGSVLSRAVPGSVPFFATIVSGVVLVLLHTMFSYLTFYSTRSGAFIKGQALVLIKDGQINWENMCKAHLTERDLLSALRSRAQLLDPSKVSLAILERNGEISIIKKDKEITSIDVDVKPGIQTIRIFLEEIFRK